MPHLAPSEPWWTPWPGTGPGHDLLGNVAGLTIIELGCGNGDNAAALAAAGATVTGIDHDPAKTEQAKQRWPNQPRLVFKPADAATYVASLPDAVDIACSIFGALSFAPARPLLENLTPILALSGQLAIAARTPPHPNQTSQPFPAWVPYARTISSWTSLLASHGLNVTRSYLIAHPSDPTTPPSAILVAHMIRTAGRSRSRTAIAPRPRPSAGHHRSTSTMIEPPDQSSPVGLRSGDGALARSPRLSIRGTVHPRSQ